MKQNTGKKILSILLTLTLVFSVLSIAAMAAETPVKGGSGYINDDYVNLRQGAGTNYSVITMMMKNTKVIFEEAEPVNSSWYKITEQTTKKTGYVYKDYVEAEASQNQNTEPVSGSTTGYVNTDYVNLRKGAGTGNSVIVCMREKTAFTLVSETPTNNWYNVKLSDGTTGWVIGDYITLKKPSGDNTDPQPDGKASTGYVNTDYVNLRNGAGTGNSVIVCMREKTTFTLLNETPTNKWYNVKLSDGTTGWVYQDYVTIEKVSEEDPAPKPGDKASTGYLTEDYVNLRKGAGTGNAVIVCMRKNTTFTLVSEKPTGDWYNVKLSDGTTGWVIKNYIKINSSNSGNNNDPEPSTGTVKLVQTNETIYTGNTLALNASGGSGYTWFSSDTAVAAVDANGIVTAKSAGSAKITVTAGKESASCNITVKSGSSVNISSTSIDSMRNRKSVLLESSTSGVSWKSSNPKLATVENGVVEALEQGYVTISAYTSYGAATCTIHIIGRDNVRFVYATPNSAPKGSNVTFKAITDTDRTDLYFDVTNGSTSYKVNAVKEKTENGRIIWKGTQKLNESGRWTFKAYSKFIINDVYLGTPGNGEGEVFVTNSSDTTTTVTGERRASDGVINLIAEFEGFLPELTVNYITDDPTIGYGRIITTNEQFYNNVTRDEAYAYLCNTVNSGGYTTRTNSFLTSNGVKFNQNQFDALVCFAYNCGSYAITNDDDLRSVLLNTEIGGIAAINAGDAGYVDEDSVNLRQGAGTGYAVVRALDINTKFTFLDGKLYNNSWYKIKLSDGTEGYIYYSFAAGEKNAGTRDLKNVDQSQYLTHFLQWHHAAGDCYWELLTRRIDEAEMFFYGDYLNDGYLNKYNFSYTCPHNPGFGI